MTSLEEILTDRNRILNLTGSLVAEFIERAKPEDVHIEKEQTASSYKITLKANAEEIPPIEISINGRGRVKIRNTVSDENLFSETVPFKTDPHSLSNSGSDQIVGDICNLLSDEANLLFEPLGMDLQEAHAKIITAGQLNEEKAARAAPGIGRRVGAPKPVIPYVPRSVG